MTEKERYEVLINALLDQLNTKENTITLKECQIYSLEKKLEDLEALMNKQKTE